MSTFNWLHKLNRSEQVNQIALMNFKRDKHRWIYHHLVRPVKLHLHQHRITIVSSLKNTTEKWRNSCTVILFTPLKTVTASGSVEQSVVRPRKEQQVRSVKDSTQRSSLIRIWLGKSSPNQPIYTVDQRVLWEQRIIMMPLQQFFPIDTLRLTSDYSLPKLIFQIFAIHLTTQMTFLNEAKEDHAVLTHEWLSRMKQMRIIASLHPNDFPESLHPYTRLSFPNEAKKDHCVLTSEQLNQMKKRKIMSLLTNIILKSSRWGP